MQHHNNDNLLCAVATASQVYSDATNALIWAASDGGARIKAFKAPDGIEPANRDAACNREDGANEMCLQYTLNTCGKVCL